MIGCVYIVTNLANGSVYIGKTCGSLEHRKAAHINASRRGEDWAFYRAMRLHGEDCFQDWAKLYESDDNAALLSAEIEAIRFYRAAGYRLYNSTDGGQGTTGRVARASTREAIAQKARGRKQSEESNRKRGDAQRGIPRSEEDKAKMAEGQRRNWEARRAAGLGGYGHKFTPEQRAAISVRQKARYARERELRR